MENFKFDLNITLDNIDLLILSLNATTKGNRSIEEADYRLFAFVLSDFAFSYFNENIE